MKTSCLSLLAGLLVISAHGSNPPRVRMARSLTGEQIARVVTNAAAGAKVGVPMAMVQEWGVGRRYGVGDVLTKGKSVFVCVQGHTSQSDWAPTATPALWRLVRAPSDGVIPAWRQPHGGHDAYAKGDRVAHKGYIWESSIKANVWAPGVYGWKQIQPISASSKHPF
jgi:hypothetical protein